MTTETRTYKCEGCNCGRVLTVERQEDGTFWLELADPDITIAQAMTAEQVLAEIDAGEVDDEFTLTAPLDYLSIVLDDAQIADLRALMAAD